MDHSESGWCDGLGKENDRKFISRGNAKYVENEIKE